MHLLLYEGSGQPAEKRSGSAGGYVPAFRFAQEDLELERGVVLEEIDMYEDSPEDVAIDKLFESCYDGSALGRPILGTAERSSR